MLLLHRFSHSAFPPEKAKQNTQFLWFTVSCQKVSTTLLPISLGSAHIFVKYGFFLWVTHNQMVSFEAPRVKKVVKKLYVGFCIFNWRWFCKTFYKPQKLSNLRLSWGFPDEFLGVACHMELHMSPSNYMWAYYLVCGCGAVISLHPHHSLLGEGSMRALYIIPF